MKVNKVFKKRIMVFIWSSVFIAMAVIITLVFIEKNENVNNKMSVYKDILRIYNVF